MRRTYLMRRTCSRCLYLLAVLCLLFPRTAGADFVPMGYKSPPTGGTASLKSSHPSIRMESEEVIIRLKPYSYTVDAVFHMMNTGDKTTEWVGFPKVGEGTPPSFSGVRDFIRFEGRVDGKKARFFEERETGSLSYFFKGLSFLGAGGPPTGAAEDFRWMVGKVTFPANTETILSVSYEAHYEAIRSGSASAVYIYGTGRHWKGTIGKAVFIVDGTGQGGNLRVEARFSDRDAQKHSIAKRIISDNLMRYEVKDLEPIPEGAFSVVIRKRPVGSQSEIYELTQAAMNGRIEVVQALLRKGVDVNAKNESGYTPLVEAASHGHLEMVKLLLEKGADINIQTEYRGTALAATLDDTERLVKRHLEIARLLMDHGAKSTTLAVAAFVGDMEAVKSFIAEGALLNENYARNRMYPLTAAARGGQSAVLELLIDKGVDVNEKDSYGRTALMAAASAGQTEAVRTLLDRGAKIDAMDSAGNAALHHAVWLRGHVDTARALLERGADVNARPHPGGRTILMEAAESGNLELVKLLVEKGADVNALSGYETALTRARGPHIEEIEKVLIKHGAKKNGKSD